MLRRELEIYLLDSLPWQLEKVKLLIYFIIILCYPITDVLLSLAHADGTPLKTEKASLTKLLESKQTSVLTNINLPSKSCSIIDGGLILYEVLVQYTTSSYVDIATELLARVFSLQGMEIHVHLLLDKYKPIYRQ